MDVGPTHDEVRHIPNGLRDGIPLAFDLYPHLRLAKLLHLVPCALIQQRETRFQNEVPAVGEPRLVQPVEELLHSLIRLIPCG